LYGRQISHTTHHTATFFTILGEEFIYSL